MTNAHSDRTHISIVLDRTGSMQSIRQDTIGGFNAFLTEQKAQPNPASLTLVQFDTQDPYEVLYKFTPISQVQPLTEATYVPRASTPLYDAVGRGINDLKAALQAMPATERPARIVFVLVTDGQENSSREFTGTQVKQMIRDCRKELPQGWMAVRVPERRRVGDPRRRRHGIPGGLLDGRAQARQGCATHVAERVHPHPGVPQHGGPRHEPEGSEGRGAGRPGRVT